MLLGQRGRAANEQPQARRRLSHPYLLLASSLLICVYEFCIDRGDGHEDCRRGRLMVGMPEECLPNFVSIERGMHLNVCAGVKSRENDIDETVNVVQREDVQYLV